MSITELTAAQSNRAMLPAAVQLPLREVSREQLPLRNVSNEISNEIPPEDEWLIDFDNQHAFAVRRWDAICKQCRLSVSDHDWKTISEWPDSRRVGNDFLAKLKSTTSDNRRLELDELLQFLKGYRVFAQHFRDAMRPEPTNTSVVFGTLHLVIELCEDSDERLSRVVDVLSKTRRVLDLFIRCTLTYKEEEEARVNMLTALENLIKILVALVQYIRENPNDNFGSTAYGTYRREKIDPAVAAMGETVDYLHKVAAFTRQRDDRQTAYVSLKKAGALQMEEYSEFPCVSIPFGQNNKFFYREDVLQRINSHLDCRTHDRLRTFTIYGRRGVGKTDIALRYASLNEAGFDAIFWIQCETAAALRGSFTDMALKLNLRNASTSSTHAENLLLCHNWLRKTAKHWLLIFDNAEDQKLLEKYWPVSKGSILITSRRYVNFNYDSERGLMTVETFDKDERWDILVDLLDWKTKLAQGDISDEEVLAAKGLLELGQGLGLAIWLTSSLITSGIQRGRSVQQLLTDFQEREAKLPARTTHSALSTSHAVDTLWSIAFEGLSDHARALSSVLCLLSPDITHIDLFMPNKQSILSPFLEFCKQEGVRKFVNPSAELETVLEELLEARLVKRVGRILSVHRVVQEAFFHIFTEERQKAFDAACRLVHHAFPKQINGRPLHKEWERCERYIQDALFLAYRYEAFKSAKAPVTAPSEFGELLKSVAWYLLEVGDYTETLKILDVAKDACEDKKSLLYAHYLNTAGTVYIEQNKMSQCREAYEQALDIRQQESFRQQGSSAGDEELANTINNTGNLESGDGKYDDALNLFDQAEKIRLNLGEESTLSLALTYLGKGRAFYLKENFEEAFKFYTTAETVVIRTAGKNNVTMANIRYAQGNLERAKGYKREAKRYYEEALAVLQRRTPMHILTSCTYYKIGCVEASLKNWGIARTNLDKAFEIAEFCRAEVDDGMIARILFMQAECMTDEVMDTDYIQGAKEGRRTAAELMRVNVEKNIGAKVEDPVGTKRGDEKDFDGLVCPYFR